jgi:hypothetical protein
MKRAEPGTVPGAGEKKLKSAKATAFTARNLGGEYSRKSG